MTYKIDVENQNFNKFDNLEVHRSKSKKHYLRFSDMSIMHGHLLLHQLFQKENGNTLTLLIIIIVKSLQKEQIAQITQYDP